MKLVAMQCRFSEDTLKPALTLLDGMQKQAILMAGCVGYDVYSSSIDGKVAVIQRWNDMANFDAYRASAAFSELGKALKPMMAAPPVTTVGEVSA
jgi:quinol monooxygenase YgiN